MMYCKDFEARGIFVGENTRFFGSISIEKRVQIWHHCLVGFSGKYEDFIFEHTDIDRDEVTFLGQGTVVNPFSIIFQGAKIGKNVEINEHSRIGLRTVIGDGTKIVYGARIYDDVAIGKRCIIAGFCCNGSKIDDETTMMGHLIHKYPAHAIDAWNDEDAEDPPSPIIEENAIVGYNSIIIGGVTVGRNSYIGAGTIITCDVPPNTKVVTSRRLDIKDR
ncbi:MAG: DapH/DapD/GlmU-related protein [Bacteroidota bacterium]|nr:hypothetical protein [Patescibacteria group bacterium]MBU1935723.1 hypothetical protein [Patescibacteria group bacterium]